MVHDRSPVPPDQSGELQPIYDLSAPQVETFVNFRHGWFIGNERSHATGAAAKQVVEDAWPLEAYDSFDLFELGQQQMASIGEKLAAIGNISVDVCLSSRARRALSSAEIVLEQYGCDIIEDEGLYERDRGIFAFMPDEWTSAHPTYRIGKESTLGWLPEGGKTLLEVIDKQFWTLRRADQLAPNGCVALSAHGESTLAVRGAARFGALTDRSYQYFIPGLQPPMRNIQRWKRVVQAQTDIWTRRNPYTDERSPHITHFRTFGPFDEFDSGWVDLRQLSYIERFNPLNPPL